MARKRFGIQFEGFEELIEAYDKLGGDLKKVASDCLDEATKLVHPELKKQMEKHKRTGTTENSIKDGKVEWEGTTGSIPVGFDLKYGGMPSIYLMYGTPRMQKDTKLYNAIYGASTQKKVSEAQREILEKAIKKRLGG